MMKIKVCTITHHTVPNFGAVMQAYALQKALDKLEVENEILNYKSMRVEKIYYRSFKLCDNTKDRIKFFLHTFQRKRYKKFDNFVMKNLRLSKEYYKENLQEANNEYDLFIAGSDQVWNLNIHIGDTSYMLDFLDDNSKKGSYAASFGYSKIPEKYHDVTASLLNKFSYLLLREKTGISIIESLNINKNPKLVIDPTLLLDKKDYLHLIKYKKKGKYILFYDLINSDSMMSFAYDLSKKTNLDIWNINTSFKKKKKMKNLSLVGPEDFISLIANSEYVITSSFHGIIFSMIFEKNFYFALNKNNVNNNSRIIDLSNLFNIYSRNIEQVSEINDLDFTFIREKIKLVKNESEKNLMDMLYDRQKKVDEDENITL